MENKNSKFLDTIKNLDQKIKKSKTNRESDDLFTTFRLTPAVYYKIVDLCTEYNRRHDLKKGEVITPSKIADKLFQNFLDSKKSIDELL